MPTNMTLDQMKQFVSDHFEEFVNKRNAAVIRKNMTPDFYDHDGPGGKPTGVEGDEETMVAVYKSMPDLHITNRGHHRRRRQGRVPEYVAMD